MPSNVRVASAAFLLDHFDEARQWSKVFRAKDPGVILKALQYLTDRRDGKAVQNVKMGGDGEKPVLIQFTGNAPRWVPSQVVNTIANEIAAQNATEDNES